QAKIEAVVQFPRPTESKAVKRFVGMVNYYHRLIPDCAQWVAPLNKCANAVKKFVWTSQCQESFEHLRRAMAESPVIRVPDWSRPFIVKTDASELGWGAILLQEENDGTRFAIEYASQAFNQAQRKYSTYDKEATGVVAAVRKWR